jgi:hypothetical protein
MQAYAKLRIPLKIFLGILADQIDDIDRLADAGSTARLDSA